MRGDGCTLRLEGLARAGLVSCGKAFLYLPGEHGSLWRVVSHGGEMIGFAV